MIILKKLTSLNFTFSDVYFFKSFKKKKKKKKKVKKAIRNQKQQLSNFFLFDSNNILKQMNLTLYLKMMKNRKEQITFEMNFPIDWN